MELKCSDTACICKSEPFFQNQCMKIKEACSHEDALKAIEVGTAICREAGVRVECKTTPVRERGKSPASRVGVPCCDHIDTDTCVTESAGGLLKLSTFQVLTKNSDLKRRHSWAFVCDSAQIMPNYQREFTRECEKKGYQCTDRGKMISKGSRGDTLCLAACRCVSVYSNCSPSYDRPKLDFWYEYCGVWKAAADDDLTTASTKEDQGGPLDIPAKERDNVPDDRQDHGIERRSDPEPILSPWKIWCADADSVRDPLLTGNCQRGGKYGCDASGLVHRSKPSDACEKGCLCVQEECNQWDIECRPSPGEPPGSTNPLVEQCKQEQKCTMDGAYIRKDGKVMDPKSACASSCYCAYSGTRCLTV